VYFQIVSISPLAVTYYQKGPRGMYCAGDYVQEVLEEDVAEELEAPETIAQGSRIYYKFK
jgi:hypothetical protein